MGSVVLDGVFQIEYVKVVQRTDGTFLVAMPSQVGNDGAHHDVAHPISPQLRDLLNKAVLEEYFRLKGLTGLEDSTTIDGKCGK